MTESHSAPKTRLHDLDALRAFAMLLGIYLHAALAYMDVGWMVQDGTHSPVASFAMTVIHAFRMPLFFLISGYFAAVLWFRRGGRGLLKHRGRRIALPLALSLVTIVPAMWISIIVADATRSREIAPGDATDIWTAAAYADTESLQRFIDAGTDLDLADPIYRLAPIAWGAIHGGPTTIELLAHAGADVNVRTNEGDTALHIASFFGRDDSVEALLGVGADPGITNNTGQTALDSTNADEGTTAFFAGILEVQTPFEEIEAGRERVRDLLIAADAPSGAIAGEGEGTASFRRNAVMQFLMYFPVFFHLWFLWFLCWYVIAFVAIAALVRLVRVIPLPARLIATPWSVCWLVPLTMLPQAFMHNAGDSPGFGPDTSIGLIPTAHVFAYYAVFFGFGALVMACPGGIDRLIRGWWAHLLLALAILVPVMGVSYREPWAVEAIENPKALHLLANLGQAIFTWSMSLGLIGLFRACFAGERRWVRYVSDSSYWLYLAHLPLIVLAQAGMRSVGWPAYVELSIVCVLVTALLLLSYRYLVRYTWIGRLLNGRRERLSQG